MSKISDFFQVGGTLSEDAPSYVERPADSELLAALERRQFCLVLGPRQMGKSSLMVHAIARMKERGITSAVVDLQLLGSEADFERWFINVIYQITRTAKLTTDTKEWWQANQHLGPTQRFMAFLEDVLLTEISGEAVLFFDEIDSVLNLPFSDDFFTTIRSIYNSRAVNRTLERLSVVLVGVATPSAFVKDRTRTPFNIGESITLTDFAQEKTKPFQDVLGPGSEQLIDRIFYWTNGQPLMVQKLAAAAYWWVEDRTPQHIDTEVDQSYLRLRIEQDAHLKFTQDYLLDPTTRVHKTLTAYRDVLRGEHIENNEQSSEHSRLKLAGVVAAKNGLLAPRNRIYQNVFNLQWVQEHLPVSFPKLRHRAVAVASLVLLGLALLLIGYLAGSDGTSLGRPLRVGITSWPGYAGGIVANNGLRPNKSSIFWDRYKLRVEFVLLEDINDRNNALAKGDVDVVWSTVDFWANELPGLVGDGGKARAIMQVDWSRGGNAIVADSSITRIEDLKGKKISLPLFTASHWLLEHSLENSSLDEGDRTQIIQNLIGRNTSSDARADFVDGKVDAAVVWEPDVTEAVRKRSGSHILVSTETAQNLIATIMLARENFIKNHPDELSRFINGWFDGTAEAHRNPDRAAKVLMGSESFYADLGEEMTRKVLTTVKLADLDSNTEMFGLDDSNSNPLFDLIFDQASKKWLKRGYIHAPTPAYLAKDSSLLKKIYEGSPGHIPTQFKKLGEPGEDVLNKPAIMTRHVYVNFMPASSELNESAKQLLDQEVAPMVQTYSNAYIRVAGNTDSPGSTSVNRNLTLERAQAVAGYLIEHYKLNRNRFIVVGNGADKPIKPNTTPEGRAANRRIDIEVVTPN